MMHKKGITITSLVIYVILLSTFTAIALSVSDNMSSGVFADKGEAINLSDFDKTLYYLNRSGLLSSTATLESNNGDTQISFSNSDIYSYDSAKKTLYYNGGILCSNVDTFTASYAANNNQNLLNIYVEFTKYSNTLQREINIFVGE